jgi:RNA polymerase sigma-70 factor (ECF subfamily)
MVGVVASDQVQGLLQGRCRTQSAVGPVRYSACLPTGVERSKGGPRVCHDHNRKVAVQALIKQAEAAGDHAADSMYVAVYEELRRLARAFMRREGGGHTWQTTDLVDEAYVKLRAQRRTDWDEREFFRVAASAMRRILIDHARKKKAAKRPNAANLVPIEDVELSMELPVGVGDARIEDLDRALSKLRASDPRLADVVELRFFAGLTTEQLAAVLGESGRNVKRHWARAKVLLHRELAGR